MDKNFWHRKWAENQIGFHENEANPLMVNNFKFLCLPKGSRIFVPLCGKTNDIAWLLSNDYRVVGIELVKMAVEELFSSLDINPDIRRGVKFIRYTALNIEIFVGDIFDLSELLLCPVDATYDRAALIALPENLRQRYTKHLIDITAKAPQLLISYFYDGQIENPPFSVSNEEIYQHYQNHYELRLIESKEILKGRLKNKGSYDVWILK